MTKLFLPWALPVSLLAFSPGIVKAEWNSPQSGGGYSGLRAMALNCCPGIHFHGPLYNYGPCYSGPGFQNQFVTNGHCGGYVPAYASTYQGLPRNPPTQWQSINPGVPGYPFASTQGPNGPYPAGPPNAQPSTSYYQPTGPATYGQTYPSTSAPRRPNRPLP